MGLEGKTDGRELEGLARWAARRSLKVEALAIQESGRGEGRVVQTEMLGTESRKSALALAGRVGALQPNVGRCRLGFDEITRHPCIGRLDSTTPIPTLPSVRA